MQKVESQKMAQEQPPQIQNSSTKQAVLIELFTSQGCSSCPSADKTLAFLEKEQPYGGAEVITLALHVDYWNYLGWKDEFSSAAFSARQNDYTNKLKIDTNYTPQMIVDGRTQFVGSDSGKAMNAIMEAAKSPKAKVEISGDLDKLKIDVSDIPKHKNAGVFLAVAESNLASNVKRGENSGKFLEHTSVVRELKEIGEISSSDARFSNETSVKILPEWKRENVKIVVFVQENESRKILGVNRINVK